jgi:hypothetical protein
MPPAFRSIRPLLLALLASLGAVALPLSSQPSQGVRDSTTAHRRIRILPALGSAPETGLQYGITSLTVLERAPMEHTRPAMLTAFAIRTAKSQTRIGAEGEYWTRRNDRRIAGQFAWQQYPLPFYGIGDGAPERDKEVFAPRGIDATIAVQQRLRGAVYGLSSVRVIDQSITPDSTGALQGSTLTGITGGRTVEVTLGALRDTRDNLFSPASGQLVQLTYTRAVDALGSDFAFGRLRFDARAYRRLGTRGVVAAQVVAVGIDGSAPFDQVALVGGGDIMRGYPRGRYRDDWFAGAQAEYRTPMRHRVGGVLFGGAGAVNRTAGALGVGRLLPTYGAGLRIALDPVQRTAIRADYGRGRDGNSGLYIGFNQAF